MLFVAYQADIEAQFEHTQTRLNDPRSRDGERGAIRWPGKPAIRTRW